MKYKQEFYDQLGQAIALVANLFINKKDKQGQPYILHCLFVSRKCSEDPELQVVGVLHDVAEDIPHYPVERLKDELNLTHRQTMALRYLTHNPEVPYDEYIKELSTNLDAISVKRADLRHNTDILRLKGLRKKISKDWKNITELLYICPNKIILWKKNNVIEILLRNKEEASSVAFNLTGIEDIAVLSLAYGDSILFRIRSNKEGIEFFKQLVGIGHALGKTNALIADITFSPYLKQ